MANEKPKKQELLEVLKNNDPYFCIGYFGVIIEYGLEYLGLSSDDSREIAKAFGDKLVKETRDK